MIGRTVGNYVIQKLIGQGGMGAVYMAEHPRIGKRVAIKVLHPELSKNQEMVSRFFNEARAVNEIRNEHIIDILDFGEMGDGTSYFAMEWLEGRSLTEALAGGRLPIARALHVASGVGRALTAAHAHGIVHRDLKPDNIFLVQRGDDADYAKVLDFGIAKLLAEETKSGHFKTRTGAILGTPMYMSPEQCRGAHKEVDHRTDIYALGVIVYQMVTGQLPFHAEGLGGLLLAHMMDAPPPPRSIEPSVPLAVEEAILQAMHKEAGQRFQSVAAFVRALGGDESGSHPVVASPEVVDAAAATAGRLDSRRFAIDTTLGGAAAERSAPPRSRGLLYGSAVALVAGGIAVAVLVLGRHGAGTPAELSLSPVAAPPTVTAAQPQPAGPAGVHVAITTVPVEATVLLDDAPLKNPFSGSFARTDLRHKLVVKARGYQTESVWMVFEAPLDLEIKLTRGSGTHESHSAAHAKGTSAGAALPRLAAPALETVHALPPAEAPRREVGAPPRRPPPTSDGKAIYRGTTGKIDDQFPDP